MSYYQPTEGPMFNRRRPFEGQSHTFTGERGKLPLYLDLADPGTHLVPRPDRPLNPQALRLRDIYDAMLVGMLHAYGPRPEDIRDSSHLFRVLDFNGSSFDPVAAAQNATVEVEKRLGIYPNVPSWDEARLK